MSPDEAVDLARRMREAGAMRFSLKGDSLTCVLRPPDPRPESEMVDAIRELSADKRKKLLDEAKEDFERDLYGATG